MAKNKPKVASKTTASAPIPAANTAEKLANLLPKGDGPILYDKTNYILMGLGVLFIIVGFALMAGGKNPDPNVFDAKEVYSYRRITLAPILILIGFVIELFAVLKKPAQPAA
jgi:hypothetical protein